MKNVTMAGKFFKLLFVCLLLGNFSAFAQKTNIWIARHAEKVTTTAKDDDPNLSAAGQKRALDLAKELKGKNIKAIYITKYKSTGLTARPLAYMAKILPRVYNIDTASVKNFAKIILKNFRGSNVLIIAHASTIMPLLNAFGAEMPFPSGLDEEDYDMLYKITVKENGKVELAIDYYGEKHHTNGIPEKYQPEINHPETVRTFTNY